MPISFLLESRKKRKKLSSRYARQIHEKLKKIHPEISEGEKGIVCAAGTVNVEIIPMMAPIINRIGNEIRQTIRSFLPGFITRRSVFQFLAKIYHITAIEGIKKSKISSICEDMENSIAA
jgi:hypothetical protein